MKKSNKLTAVYALIMDLPLSIIITLIALALGGNLSAKTFFPSFLLAYVVTFFVNFLHAENGDLLLHQSLQSREHSNSDCF